MSSSKELPSASYARAGHEAIAFNDDVVVFGGLNSVGIVAETEIYRAKEEKWSTVGRMVSPRSATTSVKIDDERILCVGGVAGGASSAACEFFTMGELRWSAKSSMPRPRDSLVCVQHAGGLVFVVGGRDLQDGVGTVLRCVDAYSVQDDAWTHRVDLSSPRMNHTATLVGHHLLVAGGYIGENKATDAVEIVDIEAWTCERTAPMSAPRMLHTATALNDDEVLVVGGTREPFGPPLRTAEIYSLSKRSWRQVADLEITRIGHKATLSPNGLVITGTAYSDLPRASRIRWECFVNDASRSSIMHPYDARVIERWDPKEGKWGRYGELIEARYDHTSTVLSSGLVFVFGGSLSMLPDVNYLKTAEWFV